MDSICYSDLQNEAEAEVTRLKESHVGTESVSATVPSSNEAAVVSILFIYSHVGRIGIGRAASRLSAISSSIEGVGQAESRLGVRT